MMTLPNPWLDPDRIVEPKPFVLDERAFWRAMTGTDDDPPPLFIGSPSPEYMAALFDEIAPTLQAIARK